MANKENEQHKDRKISALITGDYVMDTVNILALVIGFFWGALVIFLILRSQYSRELQQKYKQDIDRRMDMILRKIWGEQFVGFSSTIRNISPSFCKIYSEASAAQAGELNQICGIGYRKALEFLIKDYAIYEDPSNKAAIEKSFLGVCIKRYINDPLIKDSAELASWLGNDEAHYMRKYEDKNLQDLIELIKLTIQLIESAEQRKRFIARVEEEKHKMKPN